MENFVSQSEENLRKQLQDEKRYGGIISYAQGVHPNPRFYKYTWQIYVCPPVNWAEIEGGENFERFKHDYEVVTPNGTIEEIYKGTYEQYLELQAKTSLCGGINLKLNLFSMPSMCHSKFLEKINWLKQNKIKCVISNSSRPRRDPSAPWDYSSDNRKGVKFAPSFDDDTDELAPDGYK